MKVTPRSRRSPPYKKLNKRRDRVWSLKKAMRLAKKYLVRKFRDMQLDKKKPPKIRKLRVPESSDPVLQVVRSGILDHFMTDLTSVFGGDDDDDCGIFAAPSPPDAIRDRTFSSWTATTETTPRKPIYPRRSKSAPRANTRLNACQQQQFGHPYSRGLCYSSSVTSFHQLLALFQNSVTFVQPRGCAPVEDVDRVVRSFSTFGKVASIQDHWIQPRGSPIPYPSVWAGATVAYRSGEDVDRVLKAFSVAADTSLACVSLVDHLARVREVEDAWTGSNCHGTCVVVSGAGLRGCRTKLREEFCRYGSVESVTWNREWMRAPPSHHACSVVYKTTVNAVAAALAMDGKRVMRCCVLRTKIKMTEKELFVHRTLCSAFQ